MWRPLSNLRKWSPTTAPRFTHWRVFTRKWERPKKPTRFPFTPWTWQNWTNRITAFWYTFGRLAEQFGETDVALEDYAKVKKPKFEVDIPGSSLPVGAEPA